VSSRPCRAGWPPATLLLSLSSPACFASFSRCRIMTLCGVSFSCLVASASHSSICMSCFSF
jgi:hypothetical protein